MPASVNLRFQSDKQRKMLIRIAQKNGRSLNSHIMCLINDNIQDEALKSLSVKIDDNIDVFKRLKDK